MNDYPLGRDPASDAQAGIDAGTLIGAPKDLDPNKPQIVVVPENVVPTFPDLRAWRPRPTRKIGTYHPADVASLIAYTKNHEDDGTTVWIHPTSGQVVSVMNDHIGSDAPVPGWGDHRAILKLATTPEWDFWVGQDNKLMSQTEFAEHIETGMQEIVEPDAADVLELAQSFHATSSATFRSSTRLQSGEQRFVYEETIDAKAGPSGDLTIPTWILLELAPFIGEEPTRLAARFRFRLTSGHLSLCYKLDRPDKVKRDAIERIKERVTKEFANVYLGEPPQG
jgi:uncharacterized protein YfdQ (DUF2303 family)